MGMAKVLPFVMTDENLRKRIAAAARDSSRVIMRLHAKARMKERKVLLTQVLDVVRTGKVVEPSHLDIKGNWSCSLQKKTAGDVVKIPCSLWQNEEGEWVVVISVIKVK